MNPPASSLLVPCHNSAGHLPRLWETVRAQTRPFDEIICYDDASSDRTTEVAESLGARVIRSATNGGPAHARNQLWRAARGEWVHFHDSDDLLEPTYHAKVAARATDAADVILCNARWVRENTRELEMEWRYSEAELRADPAPYLLSHPVGGINGYYRRSVLAAIGGFDEQLKVWEDADLHVRLAVHGARIGLVEESLVIALRRDDSLSAEMRRNWRNRLRALQHYAKVLPAGCRPALMAEIENATRSLVLVGETAAAREGIALSRSLGGNPPSTRHPLLLVCKRVLGPLMAFRLQALARRK